MKTLWLWKDKYSSMSDRPTGKGKIKQTWQLDEITRELISNEEDKKR